MQKFAVILILGLFTLGMSSCKSDSPKKETKVAEPVPVKKIPRVKVPRINADSVYHFVKKQTEFGPRVPGSEAANQCKAWLKSKFEAYGANVILQDFEAHIFTGHKMPSTNIIAEINPDIKERIILAAHWDSRMIAENDKDESKQGEAIIGADDGASGVGVLVEIARILQENPIALGVDIILFDAEDQGSRDATKTDTWCLGAQYWSNNKHHANYKARYGILLDMVGAADATFYKEAWSARFNPVLQNKVWDLARKMNAGKLFIDLPGGGVMDDHYYVSTVGNIPMIDIINTKRDAEKTFGNHWHTHDDNMDNISKEPDYKKCAVRLEKA